MAAAQQLCTLYLQYLLQYLELQNPLPGAWYNNSAVLSAMYGHWYHTMDIKSTMPSNQLTGKSASGSPSAVSSPAGAIADVHMGSNGAVRSPRGWATERVGAGGRTFVSEVMLERVDGQENTTGE